MTNNPYAPPSAPVADVASARSPRERPRQVLTAIKLAGASYLLGLLLLAFNWNYYSSLQSMPGFILGQVLGLAFTVWIYYKVYMGRNWARILLLVFSAVGALFSLSSTFRTAVAAAPQFAKGQMMLGVAVNIVILWLLFVSPGREWFRREPADPM